MIMRPAYAALPLLFLFLLLATGCPSQGATAPVLPPSAQAQAVTPLLATSVLRVGTQRVAFLLETPTELVTVPQVEVATIHPSGGPVTGTATAVFHEWPFGTRGSYVTELSFAEAGRWLLSIDLGPGYAPVELPLDVEETSSVRDIGELAPFSASKTIADSGGDLSTITSHYAADPDLYQLTIAESLITGRPSVIVFASPAFCTTPTCGPQVETVIELKALYRDQASFIHVEVYDNPAEIQGDLSLARLSPVLSEWGLDQVQGYVNESWVFVLGRDGRIAARFEGYAALTELEAALLAVSLD